MSGQDGLFTVGHHTVTEVQELGIGQRLGDHVRNLILCANVDKLNFLIQYHLLKKPQSDFKMLSRASRLKVASQINTR